MEEMIIIDDSTELYKVKESKSGYVFCITEDEYKIRKLQYELIQSGTNEKKLLELCELVHTKAYDDGVQNTEEAYQEA